MASDIGLIVLVLPLHVCVCVCVHGCSTIVAVVHLLQQMAYDFLSHVAQRIDLIAISHEFYDRTVGVSWKKWTIS